MYLLDTSICVFLLRGRSEAALDRIKSHDPTEIALSTITIGELEYGAAESDRPDQRDPVTRFVAPFTILAFDSAAATAYGRLRATLEKQGAGIGSIDTLLAAHALSVDAVMVTHNLREFRRVPDLIVEDWT